MKDVNAEYDRVREMKLREMAGACEELAEAGEFLPLGERCGFCLHSIRKGCRLRVLAGAE